MDLSFLPEFLSAFRFHFEIRLWSMAEIGSSSSPLKLLILSDKLSDNCIGEYFYLYSYYCYNSSAFFSKLIRWSTLACALDASSLSCEFISRLSFCGPPRLLAFFNLKKMAEPLLDFSRSADVLRSQLEMRMSLVSNFVLSLLENLFAGCYLFNGLCFKLASELKSFGIQSFTMYLF